MVTPTLRQKASPANEHVSDREHFQADHCRGRNAAGGERQAEARRPCARHFKYEPHLENDAKVDPRWHDITVEQCLQHRGGWNRDASFDRMFQSVRFARALKTFAPRTARRRDSLHARRAARLRSGEKYAYSNFGYCVLGRIIEKITNQEYESYVKEHVLAPLNIHRARDWQNEAWPGNASSRSAIYSPELQKSVFARTTGR